MMKEIVFATNNKYKLEEIRNIIQKLEIKSQKSKIKILSLKDINCIEDLEETGDTLEANASQKALYIFNHYHYNCFADDTGLEIDALNRKPGVYSARYARLGKNFNDNIFKVLKELDGVTNRKACFRTVISLIIDSKEEFFEGKVDGTITDEKRGTNGFGYDPIFIPYGYTKTFAEMTPELKNSLSHRYIAIDKMLKSINLIIPLRIN